MQQNEIKLVAIKANGSKFEKVMDKVENTTTFNIFKKGLKALQEKEFTRFTVSNSVGDILISLEIDKALKTLRTAQDFFNMFATTEERLSLSRQSKKDIIIGQFYEKIKVDDSSTLLEMEAVKVIEMDDLNDED